jgi:hypothetical protein
MGFVIKDRLKNLKICLKSWSAEMFGKLEEKKKQLIGQILEFDNHSEEAGILPEEVVVRIRLFDEL